MAEPQPHTSSSNPAAAPAARAAHGSAAPVAHVNLDRCRLSLIKGEHRWRFRWEPGSEAALISAVADLARSPHAAFDWFDAAVVCRHIAQGAGHGAGAALPPAAAAAQVSRGSEK